MKKKHIVSWSLLLISLLLVGCEDTPTTISPTTISVSNPSFARGIKNNDHFAMTDRFSGSKANGDGKAKVKDGKLNLNIRANDLEANHPYEVHLLVGPPDDPELNLAELTVHVFPVTSGSNGKLRFNIARFDLGLGPGPHLYRLDYVIVHDDEFPPFPTNLVLACLPASLFTI